MVLALLRAIGRATPAARETSRDASHALSASSAPSGGTTRWAQIDAIMEAIEEATQAEPPLRLVILEDLHWADSSTLELLNQALRRIDEVGLLVVTTMRPPTPQTQALSTFVEACRQIRGSTRLELSPLDPDDARAMVVAASDGSVDHDTVELIAVRGDGHPLFLEEAARAAMRAARSGIPPPLVPDAVRDMVQHRLGALDQSVRDVASALAVLGDASDPARIAEIAGIPEDAAVTSLDVLEAAGFLTDGQDGRVDFRHALTRDAVYEATPLSRRRALHLASARRLQDDGGAAAAAATARHLQRVGGADNERRAGDLLLLAGTQSMSQLAFEQAASQFETALSLLTHTGASPARRREAALRRAMARASAHADSVALDAFSAVADEAATAGDARTEAAAAIGYEQTFLATGRPRSGGDARSLPLLDRALLHLERLGPLDNLGARVLAARANARYFAGRLGEALTDAQRAVEVAQASGDPGAEAAALNTRRAATTGPDSIEDVLDLAESIVERAAEAGDRDLELEALFWRIAALLELGRRDDAEAALARFGIIAERLRQPWRLSELHRMRAMIAHLDGDVPTARAEAERALEFGLTAGHAEAKIYYAALISQIGSPAERRNLAQTLMKEVPTDLTMARWELFLAYWSMHSGARLQATIHLTAAAEIGIDTIARDHAWLIVMTWCADVAVYTGDPEQARRAYEALLPYQDRYVVAANAVCFGSVERLLAQVAAVAALPEAIAHESRAARRDEAIRAACWLKTDSPASRVTRTFMFTDIVRSTNLVEAMGDEAWAPLLRWHHQVLRETFQRHRGEEVVSTGDGFFVAFATADAAIECAIAIQRRLADHRRANGFAPEVRIGLHEAEAMAVEHDYHGQGVHQAARIAALAGGGEIVASATTAAGHPATGVGRVVQLKGIEQPVAVVTLAWQ